MTSDAVGLETSVTDAALDELGFHSGDDSLLGYRVVLGTEKPPSIPAGDGLNAVPDVMEAAVRGCLAAGVSGEHRELERLVVGEDFIAIDIREEGGMAFGRLRKRLDNIPSRYVAKLESQDYRLGAFVPDPKWDTEYLRTYVPEGEGSLLEAALGKEAFDIT